MKKIIFFSLLMLVSMFFVANQALAIGLITKPIAVGNALRGETIQEKLRILNSEKKEMWYSIIVEGDVAEWIKFYLPEDLENTITKAKGPADSYFNIVVYLTVPEDTPNGDYSGKIFVITKPSPEEAKEGASATVKQKVSKDVSITVTDEENIILEASVIPHSFGLEKDETLRIRLIYDNQGNISLKPQVQVKIKENISKDTVYNAIYPYPENGLAVKPLAIYETTALEIPTTGIKKGKYIAELTFLHNNNQILKKDFKFSIGSQVKVLGWAQSKTGIQFIRYGSLGLILILIAIVVIYSYRRKKIRA